MLETQIVEALAQLLTQLGQDDAAFRAATSGAANVALQTFAIALLAVVPHVGDSELSTPDQAEAALNALFAQAGLNAPEITTTLKDEGGFAVIKEFGRATPDQGFAMLYLDLGAEDSPVFLLREDLAAPVVDMPSTSLATAMGLPAGYAARPVTRLPAN